MGLRSLLANGLLLLLLIGAILSSFTMITNLTPGEVFHNIQEDKVIPVSVDGEDK
ncbi:hypothetical protein [Gracilibacillus alcaliphilus]|uniref:hypothetical protein n=1 Tax=Gracilibacillus alcaliphilus TaxID=1401441 RepID=UPI00195CA1D1|nr:hypothetical protein [Gracilibacillus alcaliphilus]MBM7675875.1 hypothetical protein [Gracilibacillus alcaliphilus]